MRATNWIYAAGLLLLLGWLLLGALGIRDGLSSMDAYGTIETANAQLRTGNFPVSRPPGHPLSEDVLLPAFAWLAHGFQENPVLSPEVYAAYQLLGGLVCLGVFWMLLGTTSISAARRLTATGCLAFAPFFLIESSDGEEFLWGMACVLGALLVLVRLSAGRLKHPALGWALALALAVAASGYRLEFGGMACGMVFVTLLVSNLSWAQKAGWLFFTLLLFALLWGPLVLHHGAAAPYSIPLPLKVRIEIGLYKIVFHTLGVLAMIFAGIFFLRARWEWRLLPPFGGDFLAYWAPRLVLLFFALFFLYPMKPAVILPGVALLILWGAWCAPAGLWTGFVLACLLAQLVDLDCFDHREFVGLKAKPSLEAQSLADKPAQQYSRLLAASQLAAGGRRVIIANLWPWQLAWQSSHAAWPGVPDPATKDQGWIDGYHLGPGLVVSRIVLGDPSSLQPYARAGYEVWIDEDVYRELFMRYAVTQAPTALEQVGGVPCRIVPMEP